MQVSADPPSDLSHIDASGAARMVDVSGKNVTERRAVARARVQMSPSTALRVERADGPKGDVIGPARLAGIMAAKRTGELIPLCHPLGLDFIDVRATIDTEHGVVELTAEARCTGRTGIEMEAMMAASIAALTVYDMVKGVERGVSVERVELLEKTGGKQDWRREED